MAPTIPTTEPLSFVAGNSWKWDRIFGDFPASDGWQLSYEFLGEEDYTAAWASEVTASGDGFEVRIVPANTDLTPGPYRLVAVITDGTDSYTPVDLRVNVLANPATAVGAKSLAKTMVDALDTLLAARASGSDKRMIRVNGRTVEYQTTQEIQTERAAWALQYEIERNPNTRLTHAARFIGH